VVRRDLEGLRERVDRGLHGALAREGLALAHERFDVRLLGLEDFLEEVLRQGAIVLGQIEVSVAEQRRHLFRARRRGVVLGPRGTGQQEQGSDNDGDWITVAQLVLRRRRILSRFVRVSGAHVMAHPGRHVCASGLIVPCHCERQVCLTTA
jgi:hypothetical protein